MCTVPKVYRLPKGHLSAAAPLQSAPVYVHACLRTGEATEVQTGEKAPRMHATDQEDTWPESSSGSRHACACMQMQMMREITG